MGYISEIELKITNAIDEFNKKIQQNEEFTNGEISIRELYSIIDNYFKDSLSSDLRYSIIYNVDILVNEASFRLMITDSNYNSRVYDIINVNILNDIRICSVNETIKECIRKISNILIKKNLDFRMYKCSEFDIINSIDHCINLVKRDIIEHKLSETDTKLYLDEFSKSFKSIFYNRITFSFNKGNDNKYRYIVKLKTNKNEITLNK